MLPTRMGEKSAEVEEDMVIYCKLGMKWLIAYTVIYAAAFYS
jgi:hypothetical protein